MAPLGVLTAIAGAIRVGGASSLKRLIGRARETDASAEIELMSSVSQEVCELWNGISIVRSTGHPEVKQIIHLPAEEGDVSPTSFITIETANEDHELKERNKNTGSEKSIGKPPAKSQEQPPDDYTINSVSESNNSGNEGNSGDIESRTSEKRVRLTDCKDMPPNISLNIHGGSNPIELWVYAIFATILQTAVLVWSGFLVYSSYTQTRPQLIGLKPKVGFWLQAAGTVLLTWSLVLCVGIIDNASCERYWLRDSKAQTRALSSLLHWVEFTLQALANKQRLAVNQFSTEKPFRRGAIQLY